jgi:hypothetical protein
MLASFQGLIEAVKRGVKMEVNVQDEGKTWEVKDRQSKREKSVISGDVENGPWCSALRRLCLERWRDGDGDGHENTMGWRWTVWRLDEGATPMDWDCLEDMLGICLFEGHTTGAMLQTSNA